MTLKELLEKNARIKAEREALEKKKLAEKEAELKLEEEKKNKKKGKKPANREYMVVEEVPENNLEDKVEEPVIEEKEEEVVVEPENIIE